MIPSAAPIILDSTAPFDVLAKNGYYQVGNKFFNHKVNALIEASQNNQNVSWHFNNHVWQSLDWKKDDSLSVEYWYRCRAQQLREKYDYLILAFSGGADSHNVLHSFIKNGIHLDEVWCDWPLAHTHKKFDLDSTNRHVSNMPSEWTFSIKPELDRLAISNPEILINITDSTQNLNEEYADDTATTSQYCFYATVKRYRLLDQLLEQRYKKHQRIAVITGFDKPSYVILNGVMSLYFSDKTIHVKSDGRKNCIRNLEFFYWTPDMPELVRAQAHSVLNHVKSNKNYWKIQPYATLKSDRSVEVSPLEYQIWDQIRSMLIESIYPDWNSNTFQVGKNTSTLYNNQVYTWLTKHHKNHRALQSHQSALDTTYKLINDKFFIKDTVTNEKLNYQPFYTRFFPIGKLTDLLN
jgi:hypothetical protein